MDSRIVSLNWEFDIDSQTVHPQTIDEFGEGEEGRLEVSDGDIKYFILDQIRAVGEVNTTIPITADKKYYTIMQKWAKSKLPKDIFVIGRNARKEAVLTYLFKECMCGFGKKSAFDRKSKSEDTKSYILTPYDIVPID